MKAELKIENHIGQGEFMKKKKKVVRVKSTADKERTSLIRYEDILPIPLSEEVLLNCGFEKTYYGYKYIGGNILEFVLKNNEIYLGYFDDDDWCRIGKSIKYLHQLQNLYYTLTGEELEVSIWF